MDEPGKLPAVTTGITLVLVSVYLAFYTKKLTTIPCGNDFLSILSSQFVHVSLLHLASNVFSLWYLANLERSMGVAKFTTLVAGLAVASSAADALIGNRHCSIGFSGVLFGLFAWSILTMRGFKWYNLGLVGVMLMANTGPNISLRGHAIGAVTGVVFALIYQMTNRKT
jgi:membrane associated rhomboid family serine protease